MSYGMQSHPRQMGQRRDKKAFLSEQCKEIEGNNRMRKTRDHFQRRHWQPTPVLLPGKSHGQRSLVGCSLWGCYKLDMNERLHFHALEKEMATHSSVLAWRIPGTGKPGGLPSMGLQSRTRLKRLSSSSSSFSFV